MKVLMSAFACSPIRGSEPGVGWNWAREMSKYHEVWVVTRKSNKEEIENNFLNENIKFIYLSVPFFNFLEKYTNKKSIHMYYALWQNYILMHIKKIHKIEKFDLIHHVTYNEFRNPGKLWRIDAPFVLGPIGGAQQIEKPLLNACEIKKNIVFEKIRAYINNYYRNSLNVKKALKKSSKIIVANNDTRNYLNLNLNDDKVEVILETGIKEENMNYIIRKNNDKIKILWVGNLIYIKGFKLLIEAFNKIKNKDKYEIIVIGDGNMKSRYVEVIKSYNLENYINFKGKLSYDETLKQYKRADIFVFTSLRDTSGNVVLEAMSNCLPIIALNHHGCADMLTDDCAIKIDIKSESQVIVDLKNAIIQLGNNYNERIDKGINSYNRIKDLYLWESKGKLMNEIYSSLILKDSKVN